MSDTPLPKCIHCGGAMQKTKRWPTSPLVILCSLGVIAVGAVILVVSNTSGSLVGQTIGFTVGLAGFLIAKKRTVWQCQNCGYYYDVE
jgi:uncharacterized protein (DUF983 family)